MKRALAEELVARLLRMQKMGIPPERALAHAADDGSLTADQVRQLKAQLLATR